MNKRLGRMPFLCLLIMLLMPASMSAKTYGGTINIEVGETYHVDLGFGSGYTVSGYWTKTDGSAFIITSSSSGNGVCTIKGNKVGTSTLNWKGVVSGGWSSWDEEWYWTVNVSPQPAPEIEINSSNFPDNNFRQYLLSQYYGKDGKLSEDELNGISELHVDDTNIENLQGIEYFTGLKKLYCSGNKLQSLDLSNNTKLSHLSCYSNQLTSLNLSYCTELEWLHCPLNKLAFLDVSNCSKLNWLDCSRNQLSTLSVSKNNALETLDCSENHSLTALDVSGCVALTELKCYENQLTSLNLTTNTALTSVICSENQLTSLDLTANSALTSVICSENQLTNINLSKNVALTKLNCGYNSQLTSVDVSKNVNLEELVVGATRLAELDVTNNTKLTELSGSSSTITSLDLTKNTLLKKLSWRGGALESLDLSRNKALTSLSCSENQITSLDLSNCTQLESLYCDHNQLTSLVLPNSNKLTSFWMDHNRIRGNAMDMLINSLPTNNTNEPHTFRLHLSDNGYKFISDGYSENVCTKKQVAAIKAKGWTPLWYNNGGWVEYNGGYDFVIIAKDCSREYGEDNPEFEYEVSGDEPSGTPVLRCWASKTYDVGTYNITVDQGTLQGSVAGVSGRLTVNKAPLTVSVENCTRKEGKPNPDFILHYSGWKNGQDERVLTVKPTATTNATTNSSVGIYEIIVSGGEATNYAFNYVNGTLTIEEKDYKPISISLPSSQTVKMGETITLIPEITPADAITTLTWTSDNETIATVNNEGVVTGVGVGSTVINVETANGKTASCKLIVTAPEPIDIAISPTSKTIEQGETFNATYTLTPLNAKTTVTWSSDNENIASVTQEGIVKGVGVGSTFINVETANGKTASCKLTVTAPEPIDIAISPTSKTIEQGEKFTATYTLTPLNAKTTVTWSSDDESIATVTQEGFVTGVGVGSTFINVETANGKSAYCKLTVTNPQPTAVNILKTATVNVGETITLTPTLTPANAVTTFIWQSDDPAIATVDVNGKVTGIAEGLAIIKVSTANGLTSNACKLTVILPSGIEYVNADCNTKSPVFSLSGQRLAAPKKGINIIGGKKVVIRSAMPLGSSKK